MWECYGDCGNDSCCPFCGNKTDDEVMHECLEKLALFSCVVAIVLVVAIAIY